MVSVLLVIHNFSTLFMVGLIWFVQIVHYPLFQKVSREDFVEYEKYHQRRTTYVVLPVMVSELFSALGLFFLLPEHRFLLLIGGALLAIIWCSTFLVQVPFHAALEKGRDEGIIRKLVLSNWIRVVCWSLRAAIAISLVLESEREALTLI